MSGAAPPTISVLLPFRNGASTLAAAIESICAQTCTEWELLLFDDGSEDDADAVAADFAARDARIRVVARERVGIVAALQRLSSEARGEFIARMDGDDVSRPARFERQLALLRGDESIALCGCLVEGIGAELREGGARYYEWINSLSAPKDIEREMFVECPIAHPTFLMRRSEFEAAGGYQEHGWAEDYDLVLRLWGRGARMANVAEPLLQWRNAATRLSMTDARYSLEQFRRLKRHYIEEHVLPNIGNRRFVQWGAGEVGKRWLREWGSVRPEGVVDIHPRKIGTKIHGYRVIAMDELPLPGDVYILIAVGAPGAREEIRAWLIPRGYREVNDYRFIA
ncbi:MAG: glycosyltransferase [Candidatus Hydrogenedentes bacterium]|nr:glycosyltransferase [Candidatus Hydrogenedentota bacterium]